MVANEVENLPNAPEKASKKSKIKWILATALALILLLIVGGLVAIQVMTLPADETALAALASDVAISVESDGWLVFRPNEQEVTVGYIFYPGGFVEPEAYAPYARAVAEAGYLVVIPKMPLNLAILKAGVGQEIIDAFPEIDHWAVGGHSLGGVTASQFIKDNPWAAEGLVLLAAYPAEGGDISCRMLQTASIYGTRDGRSTVEDIEAAKHLLPPDTRYVAIDGGNHAQFGYYGRQPGDLEPTVGREEQQAITVTETVAVLDRLGNT